MLQNSKNVQDEATARIRGGQRGTPSARVGPRLEETFLHSVRLPPELWRLALGVTGGNRRQEWRETFRDLLLQPGDQVAMADAKIVAVHGVEQCLRQQTMAAGFIGKLPETASGN